MKKYTIPVRIDFTDHHLNRRVCVYSTDEQRAIRKAINYAYTIYHKRKGFLGCGGLLNIIFSEPCKTHFID